MNAFFRRLLTRKKLAVFFGSLAILFGAAMLHPYPRQMIFGPKIEGIPWCVWENKIRHAATPFWEKSWWLTALEKAGAVDFPRLPDSRELLPVYLHLAEDSDLNVRRFCLGRLDRHDKTEEFWRWSKSEESEILPVIQRHLNDDDPLCRIYCAQYLWAAQRDPEMIKVPIAYVDHPDPWIKQDAQLTVLNLRQADPDKCFDLIVKIAEEPKNKRHIRSTAVSSLRHYNKRALPPLRKALQDPDAEIRTAALWAVRAIPKVSKELLPVIVGLQKDTDYYVRHWAAVTLHKLEPTKYPSVAKLGH